MKKLLVILIILFTTQNFYGQQKFEQLPDTASIWQAIKYDAGVTLKSVGNAYTQPLRWEGKDYAKLGGLLVGTFALSYADESTSEYFIKQGESAPSLIRDFGWYFGSPQNYFMVTGGIYGYGLLFKNQKVRRVGVLIISSSIASGLIQSVLKTAVGRARPTTGEGYKSFDPFSSEGAYHSFPSGHTILSMTMSHSIAKQFENIWVKIGIYTVGAIPPLSRLWDGAHWLTDIAFSAALSIFIVDGVDKFLFEREAYGQTKNKKISWNLTFGANQVGLIGTF